MWQHDDRRKEAAPQWCWRHGCCMSRKLVFCSQILSFQSVWLLLVTSFGRDVCREVILPKRHRRIIVKLVSPWGWLCHLSCMQMRGEPQHLYAWNRRVSQSKRKTNPNFQTASDMPGLFPARIVHASISVKTVHDSEIRRGTSSKGCTAKQHCEHKKLRNVSTNIDDVRLIMVVMWLSSHMSQESPRVLLTVASLVLNKISQAW